MKLERERERGIDGGGGEELAHHVYLKFIGD